jgi:4-amino-4-deoxy-L-arabinose transferase-like glycosyltransferase
MRRPRWGSSGATPPRLNLTSPALLALLAAAFILPGLAGHDLWKSRDAIGLGVVHDMAARGNLLVPHIGGLPWLEDGPLYHWFALAFGMLGRFAMEFHAAARLASGAFVAAALALMYHAGREWAGDPEANGEKRATSAAAATLILLGSVGLMVHAHEAIAELAALAALCGAFAALPYASAKPVRAGLAFGLGLGLAFLGGSWKAPAALYVAVALAHALCAEWRTARAPRFLGIALACALAVAAPWPIALGLRSPELLHEWWALLRAAEGTVGENARHLVANGSWYAWPAWPLALWSAWSLRRRWREPHLFVPAVCLLFLLALQVRWGPPQDDALLVLLAPLALLAAPGLFTLRRGAVAALDWFGVLTFGFFTALVWIGYSALTLGLPGPVARNLGRIAPGFVGSLHPLAIAVALLLAAAWLYLAFFTAFNPIRGVMRWAAGIVLLWGTFAVLCMPWVDYQKSYRSVAAALKSKIPAGSGCIAARSLGTSQAAALDYHGDIRTRPFQLLRPHACPLVLVQGDPRHELDAPPGRWSKLADVGRPGDRAERYRLYRLRK